MDEENNNKDIEIVQGIGNLDISPVYDNTTIAKPKMQDEKPKDIVIPQVKKHVEQNDNIDEEQNIDKSEDDEELIEETYEDNEDNNTDTTDEDSSDNESTINLEDDDIFEDQIQFDDFEDLDSDENNNEE